MKSVKYHIKDHAWLRVWERTGMCTVDNTWERIRRLIWQRVLERSAWGRVQYLTRKRNEG